MPVSVYIHFPFCKIKCPYCGFVSGYKPEKDAIESYLKALYHEILLYSRIYPPHETVNTVYIGGGTPSLLTPVQIKNIFSRLNDAFNLDYEENTIEANPEDISEDMAGSWKECGINRISLGFQSMEERVLKFLGRKNTPGDNLKSYGLLKKAGFENISIDLISCIRNEHISELIEPVVNLAPGHISVYQLTIEEKTLLRQMAIKGVYLPLQDQTAQRRYDEICLLLKNAGYIRYEISNFASGTGYKSRHNLNYWNYGEYIGFGPGASGYRRFGKDSIKGIRWTNTSSMKEYESMTGSDTLPAGFTETIDRKTAVREYIMLGLRKIDGISCRHFENLFDENLAEKMTAGMPAGLKPFIDIGPEKISLTERGLCIADRIVRELWDVL